MKTKTQFITKLLAVFAVIFLSLGIATISLTGQSSVNATDSAAVDKPVYNFYNVENRYCQNDNYGVQSTDSSKFITDYLTEDATYGYILKLTCNTAMSAVALRNTGISFVSGVTYNISLYAKCDNFTSGSSWNIYPMVLKGGSMVCQWDGNRVQGNLSSWTKFSYEYTANGDENELRLTVSMTPGDVVSLRNIEMSLRENQFDGKLNLAPEEGFSYRSGVEFDKTTVEDSVYGNVTKFTANEVTDSDSNVNSVWYFKNSMIWKEGATYDVIFRIKTDANAQVKCYLQAKVPGKKDTAIVADVLKGSAQTSWKTYYARFKYEDMFTTDNAIQTAKDIFLLFTAANQGAEIYMTDIEVYANLSTVTIQKTNDTKYDYLDYVVTGSNYILPSITYENDNISENTLPVGWGYLGSLYNEGEAIENVSDNITIKRVLIDFATDAGAYLRVVDSADDTGIRFTATADKAAIEEALKNYGTVTEYGMHITAEGISGYLDIVTEKWKEGEKGFASSIVGFNENTKDFYTVKFTAEAYLKLKLNNGDTITIYAGGCVAEKSIVSMATEAYNDVKDEEDTEKGYIIEVTVDGKTKYSKWDEDQRGILAIFMNAVNTTEENS